MHWAALTWLSLLHVGLRAEVEASILNWRFGLRHAHHFLYVLMLLLWLHILTSHLLLLLHHHPLLGLHLLPHLNLSLLLLCLCVYRRNQRADGAHLVDVEVIQVWQHFCHFFSTNLGLGGWLNTRRRFWHAGVKLWQLDLEV